MGVGRNNEAGSAVALGYGRGGWETNLFDRAYQNLDVACQRSRTIAGIEYDAMTVREALLSAHQRIRYPVKDY